MMMLYPIDYQYLESRISYSRWEFQGQIHIVQALNKYG